MEAPHPDGYVPHLGESRQYWRDIILGVNDGLVSMFLLVAGVVGGGLDVSQVVLTGIAGALAGAVSMGAGEYLATKSQDAVLEAEKRLERQHIRHFHDNELEQLEGFFRDMGVPTCPVSWLVLSPTTRHCSRRWVRWSSASSTPSAARRSWQW